MGKLNSYPLLNYSSLKTFAVACCLGLLACTAMLAQTKVKSTGSPLRQPISINAEWRFFRYDPESNADSLIYDVRPMIKDNNDLIKDTAKRHVRPDGNPGSDFPFTRNDFDDSSWEMVDLPHDWAIKGPFLTGWDAEVGNSMGRLPVNGVAWYRKKIDIPASDAGKSVFLDVDGAMSYAMVWLNGHLVGGWPYGYASWRVDLTPYMKPGEENQLAIRLDNPPGS
jgi:beta-galactosidase